MKALGWLIRERTVGTRRAPSVHWLAALALMVIALLEVAAGVFPGPVGVAVAVQLAAILPVAFRCCRAVARDRRQHAAVLPACTSPRIGDRATARPTSGRRCCRSVYSVGRHARGAPAGRQGAALRHLLAIAAEVLAGMRPAATASADWAYLRHPVRRGAGPRPRAAASSPQRSIAPGRRRPTRERRDQAAAARVAARARRAGPDRARAARRDRPLRSVVIGRAGRPHASDVFEKPARAGARKLCSFRSRRAGSSALTELRRLLGIVRTRGSEVAERSRNLSLERARGAGRAGSRQPASRSS